MSTLEMPTLAAQRTTSWGLGSTITSVLLTTREPARPSVRIRSSPLRPFLLPQIQKQRIDFVVDLTCIDATHAGQPQSTKQLNVAVRRLHPR